MFHVKQLAALLTYFEGAIRSPGDKSASRGGGDGWRIAPGLDPGAGHGEGGGVFVPWGRQWVAGTSPAMGARIESAHDEVGGVAMTMELRP